MRVALSFKEETMTDYTYQCARDAVDEVLFDDKDVLDCYNDLLDTKHEDAWSIVMDMQNDLAENVDPDDMYAHLTNDMEDTVENAIRIITQDYVDEFVGEWCFDVLVLHGNDEVASWCEYGSIEDITGTFDCNFDDDGNIKGIDPNELSAIISMDGTDIAEMPCLNNRDYEIIPSLGEIREIANENEEQ